MCKDNSNKWYFTVFDGKGGSIEYGPFTWIEAKRYSARNNGCEPYRKDSVIFPTTRKPTVTDAVNEDAVYEWPDGTWCWKYELHEMGHMGDDYHLVFFDPEKHC